MQRRILYLPLIGEKSLSEPSRLSQSQPAQRNWQVAFRSRENCVCLRQECLDQESAYERRPHSPQRCYYGGNHKAPCNISRSEMFSGPFRDRHYDRKSRLGQRRSIGLPLSNGIEWVRIAAPEYCWTGSKVGGHLLGLTIRCVVCTRASTPYEHTPLAGQEG